MDDGTLRALKSYTNFGYSLGVCPYKFCTAKNERRGIKQLKSAHRQNGNWFGDDQEIEGKVKKAKDKNKKPNTKREDVKKSHVNSDQLPMAELQMSTGQGSKVKGQKVKMIENWSFRIGSGNRRRIFLFSVLLQIIYISFLIFQCSQVMKDENATAEETFQIFYLSGIIIIFNYFSVVMFAHFDHLATYLNAIKDTVTSIHFPSSAAANLTTRSIKTFVYAAMILTIFVVLVRGPTPFTKPRSRLTVTSLAEKPEQLPIWVKILATLFHAQVSLFSSFVAGISMVTTLWYVAAVLPVLERTKITKNDKTMDPDFLYSSYYRLTVLQNNLKVSYGEAVLTLEMVFIFITCANFFLAVTHAEIPGLLKAGFMSFFAKVFFSKLGHIHTVSVEVVDSWKIKLRGGAAGEVGTNDLWFEKFLMSTRPLRMYVGNFFYVDKTFVLSLFEIIIDQTVSLILSAK